MNKCCKDEPIVEITTTKGDVMYVCGCKVTDDYKYAC